MKIPGAHHCFFTDNFTYENARTRNASDASPLLSARLASLVFLSTCCICISLASIHLSLPRDALAGELRAQGGGRRELRRELCAGSEEAAPEEMAAGSSVASFACGMPPHTPPSLLLSRAPCSPPPCEPPRSASRCAVTHLARSGPMRAG
jgi:hypothetical protein